MILGDFNFPEIDWSTWTVYRNETHPAFSFVEYLRDNFLNQHVQGVTSSKLGASDHISIICEIPCVVNKDREPSVILRGDVKTPKWMDLLLCKKVKKKYHAWKRYTYSRSYRDYQSYCKKRNSTTKAIRFSKKKYQKGVAESSKTHQKSFWSFVKGETKSRSDLRDKNGNIATEIKDKANILNDFFASDSLQEGG
ncbi:hypothetical protein MAR_008372 [Mya arenaria]|uniref:Endonuclease/exonuclease/phosphatase domain-containing protein n=1 Tax=Mya arenaria TaxID=6604 RepID=A0ABY7DY39_MYAAR|nr:hypothetical protein MAR_008372 [Mya arenaria]